MEQEWCGVINIDNISAGWADLICVQNKEEYQEMLADY